MESVPVANVVLIALVTFGVKEGKISDAATVSLRGEADDVIVCGMGRDDAVDNTVFSPNRVDAVPACPNRPCLAGLRLAEVLENDEKGCPPNNEDVIGIELGPPTCFSATFAIVSEASSLRLPKTMLLVVFGIVDVSDASSTCDDPDAKVESFPATIDEDKLFAEAALLKVSATGLDKINGPLVDAGFGATTSPTEFLSRCSVLASLIVNALVEDWKLMDDVIKF